ncbi:MAG: aromatic ring-hydroxylating dioxygenase subunit alpha [Gammaproteobacteria bacterium]|nr:aromatic ring-hydroxylating dioxygenase subunit alpha [Gammaproteobacteria bacterium]
MNNRNSSLLEPRHYAGVQRPMQHAETLPPGVYADEEFYRWEVARIFSGGWHCVGHVGQLPETGDYRAFEIVGVPLILVRGDDLQLRVFSNTCRHRAMPLLEDSGRCRRIRCPFHSWTYGLDGALLRTPGMEQAAEFCHDDYGLVALRVEDSHGLVFVNFDRNAPRLTEFLGDFADVHAPWSFSNMRATRRRGFEVACNWKLFIQVFMEYYHLPSVHPDSLCETRYQPSDDEQAGTGGFISVFGLHEGTGAVLQTANRETLPAIASLHGKWVNGSRYTHILPSTILCATRDCMWFFECYPQGPDRTKLYMNSCFPKDSVALPEFETMVARYYERWDMALDEDIAILEKQQLGVGSPLARPGRISHLESAVGYFETWLAARVSATT